MWTCTPVDPKTTTTSYKWHGCMGSRPHDLNVRDENYAVGVPGMMYVLGAPSLVASATELVVAFVMGVGGTLKFALGGLVDIRLAMLILLGSLFGVQLGAIGTTFVTEVVKDAQGNLYNKVLRKIDNVNQTMGIPPAEFKIGSRDEPSCP